MNIPKDLHICGICKKVFNNVKLFLDHKAKCFLPQNNEELSPNPHDILLENGLFPSQSILDLTVSDNESFPFLLEYDNEEVISDINPLHVQEDNSTQDQLSQIFTTSKLDINEDDVATLLVSQLSKEVINKSQIQEANQETQNENTAEISIAEHASQRIESAANQNEQSNTGTTGRESSSNNKHKNACNVCDFVASNYQVLERHMRQHTGERPFTCCICNKKFARKDKLVVHKRIHFGDKRYKCTLCDYAATDGAALKKHLQIHTDERPHKCQMCSYRARNASHMTVHLRTHTGDCPFFCQVETCGHTFKTSTDLRRHMKVHKIEDKSSTYTFEELLKTFSCKHLVKNVKPAKKSTSCHICQDFNDKSGLSTKNKKRVRRRRGRRALCKKTHKCMHCNAAFVRQDSLRSHLRQHEQSSPPPAESSVADGDELEMEFEAQTLSPELTLQNVSAVKNGPVLLFVDNSDLQDAFLPLDQDGTVHYIMENSFL